VSPYLAKRRVQLRDLYGFDFPDDLFRFWEFANRLRPLEPLLALDEVCHIHLAGPFEVLAGRFDRRSPRYSLLLHWRYYNDPPEFFTVLLGDVDGLHWGYYLDDPATPTACVASYYTNDAFELMTDGDTLFEALRLDLEQRHRDCLEYRDAESEHAAECDETLAALANLRRALQRYETGDRAEVGEEYVETYQAERRRAKRIVARTQEGMGVVAPRETYRPLSLKDKKLWKTLWSEDDPLALVNEARQALRDGYPTTALKLGKDLWAVGGERHTEYAVELLDAAYAALKREVLREVLRQHRVHRHLPLVDILALEEQGSANGCS
jgi:Uncharacterised conserved protein (DUF2228)